MNSREISLKRAQELKKYTEDYQKFKEEQIRKKSQIKESANLKKQALLKFFNANLSEWDDYKWQMKNRIDDVDTLNKLIKLTRIEYTDIRKLSEKYRFSISPYYLSLIGDQDNDPIKLMSVPSPMELNETGEKDPMNEEKTNPAGSITRRYPDRLIINVTNVCAMYCRHCQRKRNFKDHDEHTNPNIIQESIEYIEQNNEIRDVLLTGGDALLLSDNQLENILKKLRAINHVEIIRIGTRTPVTLPQRITKDLVSMLSRYSPIYLNTQFNHYNEITLEAAKATSMLSKSGIIIGNQSVLLKGINDDKFTMTLLNQSLLKINVRPYYLFHCKNVIGIEHFIPSLKKGIEIMDFLRGNTSGLAIPTYIMNAPKGLGKVPILPDYIKKIAENKYDIRTWENKHFIYNDK
ncbi:lysine 2,3-aminomutase [Candidatus Izimaplasma bacterium ZiA1]|uniref:KamA family radical SAM protein n=1 Tax=Candidatus Izimoplasma sp. ZiA1 TaxID=2024899 RepID=UPI000BAA5BA6|nr:lysine 2,3-aminomutase [Candidatus Izimaplasma bacterium ZiA1]